MWKGILLAILVLALMESLSLYVLKISKGTVNEKTPTEEVTKEEPQASVPAPTPEKTPEPEASFEEGEADTSGMGNAASSDYPKITTEVVNGRTERTIHMGVRKWVWEPSVLRVKQGEFVRLVIHNADVNHPLYIPEYGIEAEVPPEGAVVEFVANKKGSFFFLCGSYCGVGHAEMQGTLIVE